ncbi:MAG: DUF2806 domain-containing protein [Alphaproteobacteria bacterium]|nr:DUF2806 domain-containing protein [Alphaproteobacteria bacterium]
MTEIKVDKQIPDSAGQGIGNGAELLGKGVGKGAESFGNGTGSGIQSLGQGLGYLAACIGDRIKYGKSFQQYPISTQLLMQKNGSTILEIAQSIPEQLSKPEMLIDAVKYQEEKNLRNFIKNVVEETLNRESCHEALPKDFHDTDISLAIEKAAAETSDDDLSKMWAKIFVEEATQADSINKASIDILKKIDKETAIILQEQIFPYCTDDGWFLGMEDEFIPAKMIASDYEMLYDYGIQANPMSNATQYNKNLCVLSIGNYAIYGHLGYSFYTKDHLTEPALKIKNTLKIFPQERHLSQIGSLINNPKFWRVAEHYRITKQPNKNDYAIIIDKEQGNILYPLNLYSNFNDYFAKINSNIEIDKEIYDD